MSRNIEDKILGTQETFDWEDVENKVQILSRKFASTIDWRYREDLEQELRVYAWTTSTDYWNMYRKAVDFYRHLSCKYYGETCVDDFTFVDDQKSVEDEYEFSDSVKEYLRVLEMIRKSISEMSDYKKNYDKYSENALRILDEIQKHVEGKVEYETVYRGRIKFSQLSEELDMNYKDVQDAFWLIKKVVAALVAMGKIMIEDWKFNFEEYKSF